jgi:hypothetical protein
MKCRLKPSKSKNYELKVKISELKVKISESKVKISKSKVKISELKIKVSESKTKVSELKTKVSESKILGFSGAKAKKINLWSSGFKGRDMRKPRRIRRLCKLRPPPFLTGLECFKYMCNMSEMKLYQPISLFPPLASEIRKTLDNIPALIDEVFPLPKKFKRTLSHDVSELSLSLTAERGARRLSYLSSPPMLSAYLRYFLPWNVFRLCRLLPNLPLSLKSGDLIVDIGSGPLTFAIALWIARPDLRTKPLEFLCIDRVGTVLEAGKKLFAALEKKTGGGSWQIKAVKTDAFNYASRGTSCKDATLLCAVNVFNESLPSHGSVMKEAEKTAQLLSRFSAQTPANTTQYLVVEPGVPQCGAFIADLRSTLINNNVFPLSPCTHKTNCPFSTNRRKWCHFAFSAADAPESLLRLSASAGVPKERAVLSFLFAGGVGSVGSAPAKGPLSARILSDVFPLPNGEKACYGCSEKGLALVHGERRIIEKLASGDLRPLAFMKPEKRDKKSGALLAVPALSST